MAIINNDSELTDIEDVMILDDPKAVGTETDKIILSSFS